MAEVNYAFIKNGEVVNVAVFMGLKTNCHDEETLNEDTFLWECSNSEHFLQA
jgi:hypothetical protein